MFISTEYTIIEYDITDINNLKRSTFTSNINIVAIIPFEITFNTNGTKLFALEATRGTVVVFRLSKAFDISTLDTYSISRVLITREQRCFSGLS